MMTKWVLASGNDHKCQELQAALKDVSPEIVLQKTLGIASVPETGLSFLENALIKARHAARESGLAALADDSGLVVDALDGAPGIYSARYAGVDASDQANMDLLLENLKAVPENERQAAFVCVLVFLKHADDPMPLVATGIWNGEIALNEQGAGGFGYDPIFCVSDLGKTAAMLSSEEKTQLSHRGQAVQQLKTQLLKSVSQSI
jgi:XTP/dITP diphosphohydrolase